MNKMFIQSRVFKSKPTFVQYKIESIKITPIIPMKLPVADNSYHALSQGNTYWLFSQNNIRNITFYDQFLAMMRFLEDPIYKSCHR